MWTSDEVGASLAEGVRKMQRGLSLGSGSKDVLNHVSSDVS
jgi:hypothetical protein